MINSSINFFKKTSSFFLDILFPRFCINCRKEGCYLCSDCSLFVSEAGFVCPVCGKSSYFGERHRSCLEKNQLDGLISVWDYDGLIKKLIHCVKYDEMFHILEEIVEKIILEFEKDTQRFSFFLSFLNQQETFISFIPANLCNKKKRGFDQSEIFAGYIAKAFNKTLVTLLKKEKDTKPQTNLNKEERFSNIKDSFVFGRCKEKEEIERVVLFDDVWTSGATMKECCRVLKEKGIREVWGFTIAKA